jgi:quercetin dioxygenase-like cupin family protein
VECDEDYKHHVFVSSNQGYDEITNKNYNKDALINDLVYDVSELVKERDKKQYSVLEQIRAEIEQLRLHKAKFITSDNEVWKLSTDESIVLPMGKPVGMRTETGCIYTEIAIRKESNMNKVLETGKVLKLADLLPYQEGRIVNMDLINDEKLKFVIMSFDESTGLSEHSAPGEALIFALEGQGIIGYEGQEHKIKAGENFKFAKNGKHYVKADGKFKMALLLTLE